MKRLTIPHAAVVSSSLYEPTEPRAHANNGQSPVYQITIDRMKLPAKALDDCPPGKPSKDGKKLFVTFMSKYYAPRLFIDRKHLGEMTEREKHARYENRPLNTILQGLDLVVIYQTRRARIDNTETGPLKDVHNLAGVEPIF